MASFFAAAGYLYGTLSARVPGTSDPTAFWVGNLAAPYLLIPFLAGTWRFRAIGSAAAGAVAAVAAVAGFYRLSSSRWDISSVCSSRAGGTRSISRTW